MKAPAYVPLLAALTLFVPTLAFAATASPSQNSPVSVSAVVTAQQLSAELGQISSELSANSSATASFALSPGQSIQQAITSNSGGVLNLSLTNFEHTNPDPSIPPIVKQSITQLAKITLQYMPCVATSPTVCVSMATSSYPLETANMSAGQTTNYLTYQVTLTNLSTTSATFQVTDSSFFTSIQNQLNALAAQVKVFLAGS